MKQIIIFLLIVIAAIIGYGKYNQYKRYNSPEVNYTTDKMIDINYHDKEVVLKYHRAIENVNSFVMLQWSANSIDVRTPEDDDVETKVAVEMYSKKLAKVNYYETLLENSMNLKGKGLSNKQIKFIEEEGVDFETYQEKKNYQKVKNLFDPKMKLYNGEKNAIVFEVQKRLIKLGYTVKIDGVYRIETLNAIKEFEEKNNLLADGYLDVLTLEMMFN
jgi:hypothetical protein